MAPELAEAGARGEWFYYLLTFYCGMVAGLIMLGAARTVARWLARPGGRRDG